MHTCWEATELLPENSRVFERFDPFVNVVMVAASVDPCQEAPLLKTTNEKKWTQDHEMMKSNGGKKKVGSFDDKWKR